MVISYPPPNPTQSPKQTSGVDTQCYNTTVMQLVPYMQFFTNHQEGSTEQTTRISRSVGTAQTIVKD